MRTTVFAKCLSGLAASLVLAVLACNQGSEGDRCNPITAANGHDECGSGLQCTTPTNCPESYCCPSDGKSSNPFCQPGCNGGAASACAAGDVDACAPAEAGADAPAEAQEAAPESGAEAGTDAPSDTGQGG
jgi:hypothetical protein